MFNSLSRIHVRFFSASACHPNLVQIGKWGSETGRITFVGICLQNNSAPENIAQQIFLHVFVAIVRMFIQLVQWTEQVGSEYPQRNGQILCRW